MWKYTHTDEMYHSLTGRNNSTELYHSDVYLGQDFSDGVRHFKYIKREMVNGRWKYYYKDEAYDKANAKFQNASDRYNAAENKKNSLNKAQKEAYNKNQKNNSVIEDYNNSSISRVWKRKKMKKAEKSNEKLMNDQKKRQAEYNKASEDSDKAMSDAYSADWERYNAKKKDKTRKALAKKGVKVANAVSNASYKGKKAIQKQLNKFKKKKKK